MPRDPRHSPQRPSYRQSLLFPSLQPLRSLPAARWVSQAPSQGSSAAQEPDTALPIHQEFYLEDVSRHSKPDVLFLLLSSSPVQSPLTSQLSQAPHGDPCSFSGSTSLWASARFFLSSIPSAQRSSSSASSATLPSSPIAPSPVKSPSTPSSSSPSSSSSARPSSASSASLWASCRSPEELSSP